MPSTNIAASTAKMRKVRAGAEDWSNKAVHTPSTGSERIASMASRGTSFLHRGSRRNSTLFSSHSRADRAVAAIQTTVPISGTSYRLPE